MPDLGCNLNIIKLSPEAAAQFSYDWIYGEEQFTLDDTISDIVAKSRDALMLQVYSSPCPKDCPSKVVLQVDIGLNIKESTVMLGNPNSPDPHNQPEEVGKYSITVAPV